jgi:hypothetical protein
MEQLGNIGSEVGRAARWQIKDQSTFDGAVGRALDLFDLTLEDTRWSFARKIEIARAREVFCDAATGGTEYHSSLTSLEKYFFPYALRARS